MLGRLGWLVIGFVVGLVVALATGRVEYSEIHTHQFIPVEGEDGDRVVIAWRDGEYKLLPDGQRSE